MSIYIIRHKESNNCYIGSCKDFHKRTNKHRFNCSNPNSTNYHHKVYQFMRENGGFDNFDFVEICKCENDKLREMEQYHIDFIKPSLNEINATCDKKEYKKKWELENYDEQRQKARYYYHNNKSEIRSKLSKKIVCDCGKTYTYGHRNRHFSSMYHLKHLPRH
jgi:hypothetical protein